MNRQLPERADLDHLKGQAKALLTSLRSAEPEAIKRSGEPLRTEYLLADAQRIVAREYGFPSWTKLKRHLETSEDRRTSFFRAVRGGDRETVRKLLDEDRGLLEARDPQEFDAPALNTAASRNDRPLVEVLLEYGADINARSTWWAGGFGVLDLAGPELSKFLLQKGAKLTAHAAARLGMANELKALLQNEPNVVHERGGDGQFPLHFAKTPEIVDILVDAGAELDARDVDHEGTAAQWRIEDGEVLVRLLERGATPDIYMALMREDLDLMERLLAENPELIDNSPHGDPMVPNAPGGHIYTYNIGIGRPFQVAARKRKTKALEWIQQHSSPKMRLLSSCWNGDPAIAQQIVGEHPDVVSTLTDQDQALLPEAAWDRKLAAVKLMLELGFNVNATGVHHSSALDRAAFHGFDDVIEVVLGHGPDLTIKNEFGGTPLRACIYGSTNSWRRDGNFPRSVELLIEAGAEIPAESEGSPEVRAVLDRYRS